MTDALHDLVSPFKRQLAALAEQHAAGALSQAQWDAQRSALERRLLDLLLDKAGTPDAAAAAPSWRMMAGLALVVVAIAAAGYAYNASRGPLTGETESAEQGPNSAQVVAMVEQLAQRLKSNPQDADGWAMLARSYSVMERNDEALAAYQKAIALRKDDPGLLVDYADALAVKNQHSLQGEPMALVQRALAINPDHIKGLAMAGTDAFVRKDFAKAVKYWGRVEQIGAPESVLVQRVVASLQEARKLAGLPPLSSTAQALAAPPIAPSQASQPAAPGASAASISGTVSLSPALRAQVSPEDTVFIFAKAAVNGRMPLAAERKQVKDLPYTFTLDDSKAMSPAALLSGAGQIIVSARVSKSGNPMAQPGDLSGQSGPVALGATNIRLEIKDAVAP
jgi:cytochrome c-type biogenesis protein CcmH